MSALRKRLVLRIAGDETGSIIMYATISMVIALAMLGLVVDLGYGGVRHRQAQTAADAAALGALEQLYLGSSIDTARTVAANAAQQNGFTSSNLTLSLLGSDGNLTNVPSSVVTATATISSTYSTLFLRVVGIDSATVSAASSADYGTSLGLCALCVLSSSDTFALDFVGNAGAIVNNGTVQVNSTANTALVINSNGQLRAQAINVVGGWSSGSHGVFVPEPVIGRPIPDPLRMVPTPTAGGANSTSVTYNGSGTMTINPGNYNTIDVQGNGTLVLNPGTYFITNVMKITGNNGTITGNGVTLYFTCGLVVPAACSGPGQNGGGLYLDGKGTFTLTAPTSGTYKGLLVFYDRNNTSSLKFVGNGNDTVTGTFYAIQSDATLSGNGSAFQISSRLIVDTATLNGNATLTVNWDQSTNYVAPGPPGVVS